MHTLYARPDGVLLRVSTDASIPSPPPSAEEAPLVLTVDEDANPTLPALLAEAWDTLRLVPGSGGAPRLVRDGAVVAIAPPLRANVERPQLTALLAKLDADQPLTAVELRVALRVLLRAAVRAGR